MRIVGLVATLVLAASCASSTGVHEPAPFHPADPTAVAAPRIDEERTADERAYRFVYLPEQTTLTAERRGEWLAVVDGQVIPAVGARLMPVKTIEEVDAAAREAAPNAKHRFIFRIGEEGDVDWPMGGCELPHVLGTRFLALLERDDVVMRMSPKHPSIQYRLGDMLTELSLPSPDHRTYVKPEVGPPGAPGKAGAAYCCSTGFGGFATMSIESAAGLELWEIPGTAHIVDGVFQNGDCRRARARMRWPNTPLDFTIPVAIWPK